MPRRPNEGRGSSGCPVGEVLRILGKPYVLALLHSFATTEGPQRFIQLQRKLEISPNTLTVRLQDLVQAGLLHRIPYHEIPPRVDYELTPKAHELMGIFDQIHAWSMKNDLRPIPAAPRGSRASAATA